MKSLSEIKIGSCLPIFYNCMRMVTVFDGFKFLIIYSALFMILVSACSEDPVKPPSNKTSPFSERVIWSMRSDAEVLANMETSNNTIFAGSFDGKLYALDTAGQELWNFDTGYPVKSATLIHGDLAVISSGNRLFGINIGTGDLQWKHEPSESTNTGYIVQFDFFDMKDSSPIRNGDIAYYGNQFGSIHGVNMNSGNQVFYYNTGNNFRIRIRPLIEDGVIYFGDRGGNVYAVSLQTQQLIWSTSVFGNISDNRGAIIGEMTISQDRLFFGSKIGQFLAINKNTGETDWIYSNPTGSWISGTPVIHDGVVYVGESFGQRLIAFDENFGHILWAYNSFQEIYNAVAIYQENIILLTGDAQSNNRSGRGTGTIHVLDFSGNLQNKIAGPGSLFTNPEIMDDRIYFGSRDKRIYCMHM